MPIYEYQCRGCGHEFELLVLRDTVPACPSCSGKDLEKLLSGFAVSSEELRNAHVKSARQAFRNSKNRKDEKIAEAEHVREHIQEHRDRHSS